jgi:beta-lactamase superfamily II metal-dependent hydrolase
MLVFEAIDAGFGDAILLRYPGDGGFERIILIDGGPKSATDENDDRFVPYEKRIVPRLMEIKKERDKNPNDLNAGRPVLDLDLVVCTHIDDDHIAGIERLYGCLSGDTTCAANGNAIAAKRLWFNSFSKLLGDEVDIAAALAANTPEAIAAAVSDGEDTTKYALAHQAMINDDVPGKLITVGYQPKDLKPAKIVVLNPGEKSLTKLRKEWIKGVKLIEKRALEKAAKEAITAGTAAKIFKPDAAVANLSSIVMLVEAFGRSVLLTGDQLSTHILDGLEETGRWKKGKTLHVDIMKVPHHGSTANVQQNFIDAVKADIYLFSANGKDQNPDVPVLQMVANEAKTGRKFTMAFTNGGMNYQPDRDGNFWKIGRKSIKTLAAAITELKKIPEVAKNVKFVFRDPTKHSLVFPLAPKP